MSPEQYALWNKYVASCMDQSLAPEPKYIHSLPFDAYRDMPGINASTLKPATPCQMRHKWLTDSKPNWDLNFGTALHLAVLEPDEFEKDNWKVLSPTKTLSSEGAKKAWEQSGFKTLVTQEMLDKVCYMRDAIRGHSFADSLLTTLGKTEATGLAWDSVHNVLRKIRIDFLPDTASYMVDVKTTDSTNPFKFQASIRKFGYHMSSAWYLDTDEMITGKRREKMFFIACEGPKGASQDIDSTPFICRVFDIDEMDDSLILDGQKRYTEQLWKFLSSAAKKQWLAYEDETSFHLSTKPPYENVNEE